MVKSIVHQASEVDNRSNSEAFSYPINSPVCLMMSCLILQKPKPLYGVPDAVVVGLPGGNFTDEYGRIKVQFFWDRLGTRNENSSCWICVAQIWAGVGPSLFPHWSASARQLSEGDPDRPFNYRQCLQC